MDDLIRIVAGLQQIGPYGLFVLFIIALFKEWIVIGSTYQREVERSKYFQRMAEQALPAARKAVELASERAGL